MRLVSDHFGDQGPLLVRMWTAGLLQPGCTSSSSRSTAAITTLERRQTAFLEVSVAAMRIGARTPLLACLLVSPSGAAPTHLFALFPPQCHFCCTSLSLLLERHRHSNAFKCKIHPGSLMQSTIGSSSPLKKCI